VAYPTYRRMVNTRFKPRSRNLRTLHSLRKSGEKNRKNPLIKSPLQPQYMTAMSVAGAASREGTFECRCRPKKFCSQCGKDGILTKNCHCRETGYRPGVPSHSLVIIKFASAAHVSEI